MPITTDFKVYPFSKVIRHVSANDTVHQLSAFYSWLMDLFDEPGYMAYENPIKYNTPTSYTMQNGWFMDNGDGSKVLEYLTGGSINTTGYANDVLVVDYDVQSGELDFEVADLDAEVEDDAAAVGPLLSFLTDYESVGKGRAWIRDTETHGAIADTSALTTVAGAAVTADGASFTGDEVYTNIYTIASFAGSPNPQVYIRQNHPKSDEFNTRVVEWSNADSFDRGTIDILVPVKVGGVAVDSGQMAVYVRQTADTFTHTEATVSTTDPARTPIATETAADEVNITKGEHYLLYDGGSGVDLTADSVIQDVATDSTTPPSWYAEIVANEIFADNTTGCLTLRGLRGTITDGDAIYLGTILEATANGTPGGTRQDFTSGTPPTTLGQTMTGVTSLAKRLLRGVDPTEKVMILAVDETVVGSAKDVYYTDYTSSGETINGSSEGAPVTSVGSTSIVSDYSDITIAHVAGTVSVDTFAGTFEVGEVVDWPTGGPAIVVAIDTSGGELTLANIEDETLLDVIDTTITGQSSTATCDVDTTDGLVAEYKEGFEFPLQSEGAEYAVLIECGTVYKTGRTLSDVYAFLQYRCRDGETEVMWTNEADSGGVIQVQGQFYIKAFSSYATSKVAPFGTLAGGVFFGAQGVWVEGMASGDSNNVKLTDDGGILQEPFTAITVTVSNTRVSDVITVFLEDGSTELPKKDQFTIAAGQSQSDSTLNKDVGADFPNDTPDTGWVYVVAADENEEHKYRYTAWSGEQLTLMTEIDDAAEGGTAGQTVICAGIFTAGAIQRGDIIRNSSDGDSWCYVISRDNDNQVTTTVLSSGNDWASGNNFQVGSLVQAYDAGDTMYIPYLEDIESAGTDGAPGSSEKNLTYVEARAVIVRVRNVGDVTYKIQPFVTPNDISLTGMSQAVIRNTDEVYS